jgi:hypothetical protein
MPQLSAQGTVLSPKQLATKWKIGNTKEEQMLKVTTQCGIRNAIHPIAHHFRMQQAQLRYIRRIYHLVIIDSDF